MKRTEIDTACVELPNEFDAFIRGAKIYDSSCSPEARVIFIERDGGYFLKSAPAGSLKREAELTRFFHSRGLSAEVLAYISDKDGRDFLLTSRVQGEDLTHPTYLDDPKRLCDVLATTLRELHSLDFDGCPITDRMADYFYTAEQNYRKGIFDKELFGGEKYKNMSADDAWRILCEGRDLLRSDTLIHGDYCLPNVIFDKWHFGGFIDLGNGGVGDKHVDIFWGAWTLWYNLHTNEYRDRFLDAYGRDKINGDALDIVEIAETFG